MVKRSEIVNLGGVWLKGHGLSEGSETLGLSSRVRRAAPSLQMQPEKPMAASHGAAKTATLTMLVLLLDVVADRAQRRAPRLHEGLEVRRGDVGADVAEAADGDRRVLEQRLVHRGGRLVDDVDEPLRREGGRGRTT